MTEIATARSPPPRRRSSAGSAGSRRRSPRATRRRPRRCSPPTATGATSSPSPGTSRPSRGRSGVADMLEHTAEQTGADGVATSPSRPPRPTASPRRGSRSRPRSAAAAAICACKDGKAWTLLTTLHELKGYEEPTRRGPAARASSTAPSNDRKTWLEQRRQEAEELGFTTQPYVVIIGGGQGGIALGARLRQLGVPTIIVEKNARPGDQLAQPLQVALPARPGLVRPPAVPAVPRELAGVLARRTRSATGWRCTPR